MRRSIRLIAILPLLGGCLGAPGGAPSVSARTGFNAGQVSGGGTPTDLAALPGEVAPMAVSLPPSDTRTLRLGSRILVPAYGVTFIHTQNVRAVSSGGLMGGFGGGSTRSASVRTGLTGISPATYQRIADEAHADLLQRLTAAGLQVATPEEAAAATAGAPRVAGNALDGSSGSTLLGGASTAWRTLGATGAPLIEGLSGEEAGGGLGALAMIGGNRAAQNIAQTSGALVVVPLLRLDYVDVSSSGRSLLGSTANAEATARFAIATSSKATFAAFRPGAPVGDIGAFQLSRAVTSDEPFASMSTAARRDGNWVGFGSRADTAVLANEARWIALARAAYRGFNAALVSGLVTARTGA